MSYFLSSFTRSLTISVFMAIGSICTPSTAVHDGQVKVTAFHEFMPKLSRASTPLKLTTPTGLSHLGHFPAISFLPE